MVFLDQCIPTGCIFSRKGHVAVHTFFLLDVAVVGDVRSSLQDGWLVSQCEVEMRFSNLSLGNRVRVLLLMHFKISEEFQDLRYWKASVLETSGKG